MSADTLDLYIVRWPSHGIVKVGVSQNERWRDFDGDAELVWTMSGPRDLILAIETEAHESLSRKCARPFRRGAQATPLLRSKGAGFTECYVDDPAVMSTVLKAAMTLAAFFYEELVKELTPGPDPHDRGRAVGYSDGYGDGYRDGQHDEATDRMERFSHVQLEALYHVVDGQAMNELGWAW